MPNSRLAAPQRNRPSEKEGPAGHAADFSTLAARWREEAERLRTLEANGQAAALEQAARELEVAATSWASELLTISEASAESGYSEEHLRRLARNGELPIHRNGGPKSRMYVRRGDLPTKRRWDGRGKPESVPYDPVEDARDIAQLLEARP